MPLYFLLHDASHLHETIRPPLAEAWRRRSFEPARPLCATLTPAAIAFAEDEALRCLRVAIAG